MLRGWPSPGAKGKVKVCTSCPEGVNSRMRPLPLNTSSLTRMSPGVKGPATAGASGAASPKIRANRPTMRKTRMRFMMIFSLGK